MKIISPIVFASICLMAFTVDELLPIGSSAPMYEAKMLNTDGKQVSLKDAAKANGLLVMFSCNTCPYVIKNQSRTLDIARYAQKAGVGVILINSNEAYRDDDDSFDAMKAYAKSQGYTFPYVLDKDNALADAFGATRTPEVFLFNKENKLTYRGAIDDNPADAANVKQQFLKLAIDDILESLPSQVNTTKSIGCSIKRKKN